MNALIEKLKNNDAHRIFADMSKGEQACLKEVGPENLEYLTQDGAELAWRQKYDNHFSLRGIYRIKPDYQPKPETVDLEITIGSPDNMLGAYLGNDGPYPFVHLHVLPSLPGFRGFWYEKTNTEYDCITEYVARRLAEGHKVIARFER